MRDEPKNDDLYASDPTPPETQPEVQTEQAPAIEPTQPQPVETLENSEPSPSEPAVNPSEAPSSATPVSGVFASGPVTEPVSPNNKKRKNIIKAAIIAGALVLLGGVSGSVYAFWYQNPEKVVTDALVNAASAKSMSATGVINVEGSDGYKGRIELTGRSGSDGNSTIGVKFMLDSDGVNLTINGEGFFSNEGDMYVKVNDAKKLADAFEEQAGPGVSLDPFSKVIEKIDGTWIKIGKEDLKEAGEEVRTAQKCFADITKSLSSDEAFRKTVTNETEKLYKENRFITVDDSLGSRTIGGQDSMGYKISADRTKADAFFTGLASTALGKKMLACDDSIKFDEFADNYNKNSNSEPQVELWVSRFGHTLTEASLKSSDSKATGSIVFNPVFNKDEKVSAPAESISLSEVLKDFEKAYEDLRMSVYQRSSTSSVNYN